MPAWKRKEKFNITAAQFNESADFGLEAEFPADFVLAKRAKAITFLSRDELIDRLRFATGGFSAELKDRWLPVIENGELIELTLGDHSRYDVVAGLASLRSVRDNQKSVEQKLVQRTLSILQQDFLTPMSELELDLLWWDLHVGERSLAPQARPGAAVNFYSFPLYLDSERRVRVHVINPSDEEKKQLGIESAEKDGSKQVPAAQGEFPHDHYGHNGSCIMDGGLVNQFFRVQLLTEPQGENEADFALYTITKEPPVGKTDLTYSLRTDKHYKRGADVDLTTISSHYYAPGKHYNLPAIPGFLPTAASLKPHELTVHQIGTKPGTVTLFNQWTLCQHSFTTRPTDLLMPSEEDVNEQPRPLSHPLSADWLTMIAQRVRSRQRMQPSG